MIKWFLRRQIAAFERAWNYDASHIYEMIDTDPRAAMAFGKVIGFSHHAGRIVAIYFTRNPDKLRHERS